MNSISEALCVVIARLLHRDPWSVQTAFDADYLRGGVMIEVARQGGIPDASAGVRSTLFRVYVWADEQRGRSLFGRSEEIADKLIPLLTMRELKARGLSVVRVPGGRYQDVCITRIRVTNDSAPAPGDPAGYARHWFNVSVTWLLADGSAVA